MRRPQARPGRTAPDPPVSLARRCSCLLYSLRFDCSPALFASGEPV